MYYYVYIVDHVYVVNYSFYDVIYDVIIYIYVCLYRVSTRVRGGHRLPASFHSENGH